MCGLLEYRLLADLASRRVVLGDVLAEVRSGVDHLTVGLAGSHINDCVRTTGPRRRHSGRWYSGSNIWADIGIEDFSLYNLTEGDPAPMSAQMFDPDYERPE